MHYYCSLLSKHDTSAHLCSQADMSERGYGRCIILEGLSREFSPKSIHPSIHPCTYSYNIPAYRKFYICALSFSCMCLNKAQWCKYVAWHVPSLQSCWKIEATFLAASSPKNNCKFVHVSSAAASPRFIISFSKSWRRGSRVPRKMSRSGS